jgi:hypothetical protein
MNRGLFDNKIIGLNEINAYATQFLGELLAQRLDSLEAIANHQKGASALSKPLDGHYIQIASEHSSEKPKYRVAYFRYLRGKEEMLRPIEIEIDVRSQSSRITLQANHPIPGYKFVGGTINGNLQQTRHFLGLDLRPILRELGRLAAHSHD